jgi:hypothetical protein
MWVLDFALSLLFLRELSSSALRSLVPGSEVDRSFPTLPASMPPCIHASFFLTSTSSDTYTDCKTAPASAAPARTAPQLSE